jgi:hypothetical protein
MKYPTTRFKSLQMALIELEPFVRNPKSLFTGRGLKQFGGMRPREMWANWLVCAVYGFDQEVPLTFCSDPVGGDGIFLNTETGETLPSEHVMVPPPRANDRDDIETRILKKIDLKRNKGQMAYASGKTLVLFVEGGNGEWSANKVAKRLPEPLYFAVVWVVGLQRVVAGEYEYAVTSLDLSHGNAPTWIIRIAKDFDSWAVRRIQ